MGYNVYFSNTPDIVVCGSILEDIKYNNTKIWGVGFHLDKEISRIKNPNLYYTVRGKLTLNNLIKLNKLNISSKISLGEPGLLLSRFLKLGLKKSLIFV